MVTGELIDGLGIVEHCLHLVGHLPQRGDGVGDLVAVERATHLSQIEAEHIAGDQLSDQALGGGHGDLRASMGVDHGVGLTRDRGAVGIADRQYLGALLTGIPDRHQSVCGLTRLADRDHQGVAGQDRVAIAELMSQLDLARDPGPVLDRIFGDQSGVVGGAATDHHDPVDVAELALADPHFIELEGAFWCVATQQRIADHFWLLEDLLAHEPVVAALLSGRQIPIDVVLLAGGWSAVEVGDLDAVTSDRHNLVLGELKGITGVLDEGGHIGAEEVLALAEADHERRVAACGNDPLRVIGVDGHECESPLQPATHLLHGGGEVAGLCDSSLQQVRGDLGVGLGDEISVIALQLLAEGGEVFDDPVVHHGHAALLAKVRVGIDVIGRAMGGPTGVADADLCLGEGVLGEGVDQIGQLAGLLVGDDRALGDHGYAG